MPQALTTSVDLNQPSSKRMAYVKNRNNVTDIHLRRQIHHFERAKSMSILNIDHDKLDLRDFLKQLKICNSNELPEARHWLGAKSSGARRNELKTVRVVSTAPASGRDAAAADTTRQIQTAPAASDDKDPGITGKFRTQRRDTQAARMLSIYNRRAELVDCGPVWGEPTRGSVSGTGTPSGDMGGKSVRIADNMSTASKADILVVDHPEPRKKDPTSSSKGKTQSASYQRDTNKESRDCTHRPGDFMKELLVKNAKRRYRKKRSVPLEDRLTDFYTKLDQWKHETEECSLTDREAKRQYILLTQGVKAALADSSDEEDNNVLHTI